MKKLFILFAICLCAISCEQNDIIDTKVKIEKVIPDGIYSYSKWRMLWYQNGELGYWESVLGSDEYSIIHKGYYLIENNIPYEYDIYTCRHCGTQLIVKSSFDITIDLKHKNWRINTKEYDIIKYTEDNITLIETVQSARGEDRDNDYGREYFVLERVDDNGELFQKLKAAKSYTLEEYRKWWKENGCDRCGYYID